MLDSKSVKEILFSLGADLCGIAGINRAEVRQREKPARTKSNHFSKQENAPCVITSSGKSK